MIVLISRSFKIRHRNFSFLPETNMGGADSFGPKKINYMCFINVYGLVGVAYVLRMSNFPNVIFKIFRFPKSSRYHHREIPFFYEAVWEANLFWNIFGFPKFIKISPSYFFMNAL